MSHAKLSPSASKRWLACPGSIRLGADMPNQSSAAAEEGTQAHALAESILLGNEIIPDDFDMLANVRVYTDYVQDLVKETGGDLFVEGIQQRCFLRLYRPPQDGKGIRTEVGYAVSNLPAFPCTPGAV